MDKVASGNIVLHTDRTLEEVTGDQMGVSGLRLRDTKNSDNVESPKWLVYLSPSASPNTAIFEGQLELENGYIKVQSGIHGNATQTSIRACSPPAMSWTISIVRPSLLRAPAAWRRWTRSVTSTVWLTLANNLYKSVTKVKKATKVAFIFAAM